MILANPGHMKRTLTVAIFLCILLPGLLHADVVPLQISGNEVNAQINVGLYQADLTITFENASNLTQNSLTVSAAQINPTALLSRLSDPALISIPAQLPILINISPATGSNLSFTGVYTIDLHTSNLAYDASLRLFTSPSGGTFQDITNFSGVGSYRVHGTGGGFSDFLILADVRNVETVIQSKFTKLQDSLNSNSGSIAATTLQTLQSKYNAALLAYQSGSKDSAVTNLNSLIDTIVADDGTTIPNIYRASTPNTKNVAGELRKLASTLIFSLRL